MTLLGRLLRDRRAGDAHLAWHLPNLTGPEALTLTSRAFAEGESLPLEQCEKRIGGKNVSPHLTWTAPPAGTAQLLLVVEDIDVPLAKPAVHCVALVDPAVEELAPGALNVRRPTAGVTPLRGTVGRGYRGPGPIKGHGPHRYVFQLFALSAPVGGAPDAEAPRRERPRALLPGIDAEVLGRGRLNGVYER
ncbi:hypothetical protein RVR_9819 [Actinacidiphila reveromycinica]|uniref:PEBP family protein n=1 Tax=Actinacidiphila reveromycinica TaxID=659352 RepID=A0A7U3V0A0_9ACTN|nr:YbhB/YbcL family Raf kinase inhibitor-like protein [Streptomyces sp. SN-593]BBB02099.1 hypothetical protein RVR_9819 [Streptomyces sp. SN-593]